VFDSEKNVLNKGSYVMFYVISASLISRKSVVQ